MRSTPHPTHLAQRERPRVGGLILLSLLLFAVPALSRADDRYLEDLLRQARSQHLAEERYWQLLLHYHRDLLGRLRSDIDDPRFFLSPAGRKDPQAELDATLKAFFHRAPKDDITQHPQCLYPARYAWLKQQLRWDARLTEQPCSRFEKWRGQMDPESVSLIFASYYLNNPASMYGHTFLRLNARGHDERQRLLDYTVNFAAHPDTQNGVLFAIEGLTGGYPGSFSTMPYYLKVQEYNNLESRDLWEYALQLSPAAVERLVRHLWEMGQASMAYYFLKKNCSYQLLPLLEVAEPTLHLTNRFWLKAIPVDTLRRVIAQPGLLGPVQLRSSHISRMLAARAQLTRDEVHATERLARSAQEPELRSIQAFPEARQARVLDSAYDLFRYRTGFRRDQPVAVQDQERRLLLARNRLSLSSSPANDQDAVIVDTARVAASPDQGHPTGRVAVSFGLTKHSTFEEVSLRPAIHDQDDAGKGYIPGSQLRMFDLRARYDNDRKTTYLQEFTLIDIMSLSPWDRWVRKPSWGVHTGAAVAHDLDRAPQRSLYYGLDGGSGLAYQTHLWKNELFYALARADGGVGGVFRDNYRIGGGANAGVIIDAVMGWRLHFNADYLRYPVGESGEVVKLQLIQVVPLGRAMQFRAVIERQNAYKEVLFTLLRYL